MSNYNPKPVPPKKTRRGSMKEGLLEDNGADIAAGAIIAVTLFIVWAASMAALGWFAYLMYFWVVN